ncbi:MAG: hypothetical protein EOP47_17000 [Sphingobacteriaceae bacterium]|nr:MAG: hypothetical protein EOP47_17000 [Sphingobacteriaceae bacterium]
MIRHVQKVSFSAVMKLWLFLLFCSTSVALAQDKTVDGIVFDKETKERIAQVNVRNLVSKASGYNNLKGEFKINAGKGDALIFTKDGFFSDTITVQGNRTLAVYLKRTGIQLKQVDITENMLTPEKRLAATKRDYTKIYGNNDGFLALSPGGGVGLGLDALYNAFSKSGRNAEHLKGIIESDYRENVIDYRFNRTQVSFITGLTDQQLTDFMFKYRPGYYFVTTATEYEFIRYIRTNYKRYLRNPKAYSLRPLDLVK